jgi:CRISPR/Cas system-associated exonuclease Cas4 (RecB family)
MLVGFICHESHEQVSFEKCLLCSGNHPPCGISEAVIQAIVDSHQPRQGLHVSDLTKCPRQIAWKDHPTWEYPMRSKAIILGTAFHMLMEATTRDCAQTEYDLEVEVAGRKLVGRVDHYNPLTETLVDYKTTAAIYYDLIPYGEHVTQLNLYAYMLRKNDHPVNEALIQYISTDNPKCKKCRRPVVPTLQGEYECRCGATGKGTIGAALVDVPLNTDEEIELFIHDKLAGIDMAEKQEGWMCSYCAFEEECNG